MGENLELEDNVNEGIEAGVLEPYADEPMADVTWQLRYKGPCSCR